MKRLGMLCAAVLVLAACGGKKREEALARQRAEEARVKVLTEEVKRLKQSLQEAESARTVARNGLEELQVTLADTWGGEAAALENLLVAAEVPEALQGSLRQAQKEMGGLAPEQRFSEGLAGGDMEQVATAMVEWAGRDGVTPQPAVPEEPVADAAACERVEVGYSCVPLPLEGDTAAVAQLCRMKGPDPDKSQAWVLHSELGRLVKTRLRPMPDERTHFRSLRILTPGVWLVKAEEQAPAGKEAGKAGERLVAFERRGTEVVFAHMLPLRPGGKLAEVDLDADGAREVMVAAEGSVEALHHDASSSSVSLWKEQDVCSRLEGHTDAALAPVRAACEAWAKSAKPASP
jgi:hypothetical protein